MMNFINKYINYGIIERLFIILVINTLCVFLAIVFAIVPQVGSFIVGSTILGISLINLVFLLFATVLFINTLYILSVLAFEERVFLKILLSLIILIISLLLYLPFYMSNDKSYTINIILIIIAVSVAIYFILLFIAFLISRENKILTLLGKLIIVIIVLALIAADVLLSIKWYQIKDLRNFYKINTENKLSVYAPEDIFVNGGNVFIIDPLFETVSVYDLNNKFIGKYYLNIPEKFSPNISNLTTYFSNNNITNFIDFSINSSYKLKDNSKNYKILTVDNSKIYFVTKSPEIVGRNKLGTKQISGKYKEVIFEYDLNLKKLTVIGEKPYIDQVFNIISINPKTYDIIKIENNRGSGECNIVKENLKTGFKKVLYKSKFGDINKPLSNSWVMNVNNGLNNLVFSDGNKINIFEFNIDNKIVNGESLVKDFSIRLTTIDNEGKLLLQPKVKKFDHNNYTSLKNVNNSLLNSLLKDYNNRKAYRNNNFYFYTGVNNEILVFDDELDTNIVRISEVMNLEGLIDLNVDQNGDFYLNIVSQTVNLEYGSMLAQDKERFAVKYDTNGNYFWKIAKR